MPKDFPSFSTSKKSLKFAGENLAILAISEKSANSQSKFYSSQKNKSILPKNLTICPKGETLVYIDSAFFKEFPLDTFFRGLFGVQPAAGEDP